MAQRISLSGDHVMDESPTNHSPYSQVAGQRTRGDDVLKILKVSKAAAGAAVPSRPIDTWLIEI